MLLIVRIYILRVIKDEGGTAATDPPSNVSSNFWRISMTSFLTTIIEAALYAAALLTIVFVFVALGA